METGSHIPQRESRREGPASRFLSELEYFLRYKNGDDNGVNPGASPSDDEGNEGWGHRSEMEDITSERFRSVTQEILRRKYGPIEVPEVFEEREWPESVYDSMSEREEKIVRYYRKYGDSWPEEKKLDALDILCQHITKT